MVSPLSLVVAGTHTMEQQLTQTAAGAQEKPPPEPPQLSYTFTACALVTHTWFIENHLCSQELNSTTVPTSVQAALTVFSVTFSQWTALVRACGTTHGLWQMEQVNWPHTGRLQRETNSCAPFNLSYSTNWVKLEWRQERTTNSRRWNQAQHFSSSEVMLCNFCNGFHWWA